MMELSILITQLSQLLPNKQSQQAKQELLKERLSDATVAPTLDDTLKVIAKTFKSKLQKNEAGGESEELRQWLTVCNEITKIGKWGQQFNTLDKKALKGLSEYIKNQQQAPQLSTAVYFVENMFLEHGFIIYAASEQLFISLLEKFPLCNDHSLLVEILIEMIQENKNLVKLASKPYFFLEYFLHDINQETQLDRQLYWIEAIKKIYSSNGQIADDNLFYDNDFRLLIDLLARLIEHCPDGEQLRVLLECYLVLSCSKKMTEMFRINDIQNYLSSLDCEALGILDIAEEIKNLTE